MTNPINIYRDIPIIGGVVQAKGSITDADGQPINNETIDNYLDIITDAVQTGLTGMSRRGDRGHRNQFVRSPWQHN